jgi:predicted dehydrogenase
LADGETGGLARGDGASISSRDSSLRVGVVGAGALGRHHVRILKELPGVELVGFSDVDPEVAGRVSAELGVAAFPELAELADRVEAAVLAIPTVDHCAVGLELLDRGLHLLVEKPIAATVEQADALVERAAAGGLVLAVGHVEFFNPAVQALVGQQLPVLFVEVQRLGAFSRRSLDVDVILDLMIHDLQILHALDSSPVAEIRATGVHVLSPRIDIANVRVELESGCVANLTASRISANRVRKLRVFAPDCYFSLDYQAQEIKGFRLQRGPDGPGIVPAQVPVTKDEPLRRELEAFVAACRGGQGGAAVVDGREARRALATALEVVAAVESRALPGAQAS